MCYVSGGLVNVFWTIVYEVTATWCRTPQGARSLLDVMEASVTLSGPKFTDAHTYCTCVLDRRSSVG